MAEGERVVVVGNLRVRARELVHVEFETVLGAVAPRRDAGEVRGRLCRLED